MKYQIKPEDYGQFKRYYIYYRRLLSWYPVMDWALGHPRAFETEEEARAYARANFDKLVEKQK